MNKKKKLIIIISLSIVLLIGGIFLCLRIFSNSGSDDNRSRTAEVIDTIEGFGYTLLDRDKQNLKDEFANLRRILTEGEIDYNEYALSIARLFVMDFYTLVNKFNKYDVGGLQFVDSRIKDNFEKKAIDTIYKFIEDNTDGRRTQVLPEVRNIISAIVNVDITTYIINEEELEAIVVDIEWDYVRDLGYDSKARMTFIRDGKRLVLVDFQTDPAKFD